MDEGGDANRKIKREVAIEARRNVDPKRKGDPQQHSRCEDTGQRKTRFQLALASVEVCVG